MKYSIFLVLSAAFIIAAFYYEVPQSRYERYLIQKALREIQEEGPAQLYSHEKEDIKRRLKETNNESPEQVANPLLLTSVLSHEQRLFHKLGYKPFQQQDYEIDEEIKNIKRNVFRQLEQKQGPALTLENTEPLKIFYNWVNFDKEKSPPYRQCFNTGDWYYKGSHKVTSPPTGTSYKKCLDPNDQSSSKFDPDFTAKLLSDTNCWGKCADSWVLTPDVIKYTKESIEKSLEELEETLRVPKVKGRMKFKQGTGSYIQLYESWGYSKADIQKVRCFADGYFYGTPFEDKWCTEGLPEGYNFVITISNNPPFRNDGGGGGLGGPNLFDQYNRPTAGIYQLSLALKKWHQNSLNQPADFGQKAFRSLSLHEVYHALGFTISVMQTANIVHGPFKVYVEPDNKGVSDDSLCKFFFYRSPSNPFNNSLLTHRFSYVTHYRVR